jgi:mannosyltransferase OCH1-like enzyme
MLGVIFIIVVAICNITNQVVHCDHIDEADTGDIIPQIIFQTYHNKDYIPQKVFDNIQVILLS